MAESTRENTSGLRSSLQRAGGMPLTRDWQASANSPIDAVENRTQASTTNVQNGPLTCQWCTVPILEGQTTCPQCGSTGVPDSGMVVPGGEIRRLSDDGVIATSPIDVDEFTGSETPEDSRRVYKNSASQQGETTPIILGMVGVVVACLLIGILAGPLLAPLIEDVTGTAANDTYGLRRLGGLIGLMAGLFLATSGLWLIGKPGKR